MPTPHDALFKLVFRHPAHAAAELRHVLPAGASEHIGWPTLRLLDGSRVDGDLREHHADLVYSVELLDRNNRLYIVLEHKSGADRFTPLQFMRYVTGELENFHARPEPKRPPPGVVAVLVHHGATPWPWGADLLAMSTAISGSRFPPVLARCMVNPPFLLDDLCLETAEDLRARDMPALARLALFCLKRARHSSDLIQELRSWIAELRMVGWNDPTTVTHMGLLRYIMEVTNLSHARLSEFLRIEVGPEAEKTMKTTYDKILEEGEAKGMATLLLGQLERRFGPLPETVVQRIQGASPEQLGRWAARVLTESSLDEVLTLD